MENKQETHTTAASLAEKLDEIHIKHGLPIAKWGHKTGYIITMSQKPIEELKIHNTKGDHNSEKRMKYKQRIL